MTERDHTLRYVVEVTTFGQGGEADTMRVAETLARSLHRAFGIRFQLWSDNDPGLAPIPLDVEEWTK